MDSMKGIEEGKGVMQSVRMLVMCCRITLVLEVPSWIGFSTFSTFRVLYSFAKSSYVLGSEAF